MAGVHTLPPAARLRHRADFTALRRVKGRVRGTFFMFRYGPSAGELARMGTAVSRKVSLRAVERNRIKRHVRESFRHQREQLPPVDVLVIAHRDAAGQSAERLRKDLEQLWARIRALK